MKKKHLFTGIMESFSIEIVDQLAWALLHYRSTVPRDRSLSRCVACGNACKCLQQCRRRTFVVDDSFLLQVLRRSYPIILSGRGESSIDVINLPEFASLLISPGFCKQMKDTPTRQGLLPVFAHAFKINVTVESQWLPLLRREGDGSTSQKECTARPVAQ
ncbi:hypothetical protein Mapa_012809 [Marchantia paleacea]|nr:hypothetical protein Mapa_012809 [Marchantia paleacea]